MFRNYKIVLESITRTWVLENNCDTISYMYISYNVKFTIFRVLNEQWFDGNNLCTLFFIFNEGI